MIKKKSAVFAIFLFFLGCSNCDKNETESMGTVPGGCGSDYAPAESTVKSAANNSKEPPPGWHYGAAWVIAADRKYGSAESFLTVENIRFFCSVAGQIREISSGVAWQALYIREPWFNDDVHETSTFDLWGVGAPLHKIGANRVLHFATPRVHIPNGATECYAEGRFKMTGFASVQIGIDWWIDSSSDWCGYNKCNQEASASNWCGSNNTSSPFYQTLTAGK